MVRQESGRMSMDAPSIYNNSPMSEPHGLKVNDAV